MISKFADVQSKSIGAETTVWQFCVILPGAVIGNHCNINCNVFIENDVIIGNNVTIKPGVQIWDGIIIKDFVFIGPNVTFTNDLYPRSKQHHLKPTKTILEEGVSVGANATVLSGLTISKYAMIGIGSVVTKDIAPFTLWFGNPAKHKGYVTKKGKVLNFNLMDKEGNNYQIINEEPIIIS